MYASALGSSQSLRKRGKHKGSQHSQEPIGMFSPLSFTRYAIRIWRRKARSTASTPPSFYDITGVVQRMHNKQDLLSIGRLALGGVNLYIVVIEVYARQHQQEPTAIQRMHRFHDQAKTQHDDDHSINQTAEQPPVSG